VILIVSLTFPLCLIFALQQLSAVSWEGLMWIMIKSTIFMVDGGKKAMLE